MKRGKKILVFNVGSSSIKYSLFKDLKKINSNKIERLQTKKDFKKNLIKIIKEFKNKKIDLILHRVVHGGNLKKPQKITSKIKQQIKKFLEFAPLHNPQELMAIKLCKKLKTPQYVIFDTSFFSELPEIAKIYPIPKELTKKYKIQRYGFHGLSHKSASQNLKGKTIVCHLGAGCSITAIKNSKPIDTSMGLSPLGGIMMATRSGNIDPEIIFFLQKKGYNVQEILNFKSGLKGLSGYSDFRDILSTMKKNKNSKLTYEIFIYSVTKQIGAYIAALNGLNNLVFTGAIGSNNAKIRKDICKNLKYLKKFKIIVKKSDEDLQMIKEVLK